MWLRGRHDALNRTRNSRRREWLEQVTGTLAAQTENRGTAHLDALAQVLDIAILIYDRSDILVTAAGGIRRYFPVDPAVLQPGSRLRDLIGSIYDLGVRFSSSGTRFIAREDFIAERIAIHWRERYERVEKLADGRALRLVKRRMPDGFLIATISEVTDQQRRDDELESSRREAELAHHILDYLATPVLVKDSDLRFVFVNTAFCRLMGLEAASLIGCTAQEVIGPEAAGRYELLERKALDTGSPVDFRDSFKRADGHTIETITRTRRTIVSGKRYLTISFDDVSSVVRADTAAGRENGIRKRALALDTDLARAKAAASVLRDSGYEALALSDPREILAFVDHVADKAIAIDRYLIDAELARQLLALPGLARHPELRQSALASSGLASSPQVPPQDKGASEPGVPIPVKQTPAVPSAVAVAKPPEWQGAAAPATSNGAGGTRILVAEDNDINQIVISQILDDLGATYTIVSNGEEAVTAWKEWKPDIILMDVSMPVMNGLQATAAIRAAEEAYEAAGLRTPIIAVTAHAMSGDRDKCFAAGMDDYLSKPVTPEEVATVICNWIAPGNAICERAKNF